MEKGILQRQSLSRQVSDKLEELISTGTYQVGSKIPTEPELMELFGVSRNTIREAIQSLTWAGLLNVKQGDGTYVCASDRFAANMEQRYQSISVDDIAEARNCIEVTIAHLAAKRRTPQDVDNLRTLLQRRAALLSDVKENTKADLDFHIAIAHACHNQILIDMYESMACYLESQIEERSRASQRSSEEIDQLHEQLFLAILQGDAKNAAHSAIKILQI